jgi:hypothetical protein
MRVMLSASLAAATLAAATITAATLAAAVAAGSGAFAQNGTNRAFCLLTGPARECGYDTFAQCEASKRGNADSCVPNNTFPGYFGGYEPQ